MKKRKSLNLTTSKLALSKKTIASLNQANMSARGGAAADSIIACGWTDSCRCDPNSETGCITNCATC